MLKAFISNELDQLVASRSNYVSRILPIRALPKLWIHTNTRTQACIPNTFFLLGNGMSQIQLFKRYRSIGMSIPSALFRSFAIAKFYAHRG